MFPEMFHNLNINVSEMCHKKQFDSFLTHFQYKCFLKMFQNLNINVSEMCQLISLWQNSDTFPFQTLTVFRHNYGFRHILDTFPNLVRQISDRVWHLTEFWQISDTFQTVFWQFFATDRYLTVFRQISDTFL